jgi:hypothetical protein
MLCPPDGLPARPTHGTAVLRAGLGPFPAVSGCARAGPNRAGHVPAHLSREAMQLFGICFDHFNKLSVQKMFLRHVSSAANSNGAPLQSVVCQIQKKVTKSPRLASVNRWNKMND